MYDPTKYPNPALQWFFKILQALALEEDLPEQPEDKTLPRYRQIHKRTGGYVIEWGEKLDKAFDSWLMANQSRVKPSTNGASKRTAAPATASRSKKAKDEDDSEGLTDAAMRAAYQKGRIEKFKVNELKSWMKTKGLSVVGLKTDLVDGITSYFETKMETD